MPRKHFKSLDALRFFAFLKVFLLHLPLVLGFPIYNYLKSGGGIGVSFFFVLSGFLISHILISEKLENGDAINPRRFFLRRALRIWPLYFTGVILAYAGRYAMHHISPGAEQTGYTPQWFYSFTFTENYAMIAHNDLPDGAPLAVFWSLCIEEHFYLLWLLLFTLVSVKHIPRWLFGLWGFALVLRLVLFLYGYGSRIIGKEIFTSLDYFAAGGLLAYLFVFVKPESIRWSKAIKAVIVVITLLYIFNQQWLNNQEVWQICEPTVSAILFSMLIAAMVTGTSQGISDRHILSRLGHISYGLYVYHTVVIIITGKLFQMAGINLQNGFWLLIYAVAALGLTILSAHISYRFIEKPFLSFREKRFAYNK